MNIGFSMRSAFEGAVRDVRGGASALAAACLSNFEDLINALQTWGQVEHNEDGTHGDVTADSITVAGLASVGRLRLAMVTYTDPVALGGVANDVSPAGLASAGCLRIEPTAAGLIITGISGVGFAPGDLLLVVVADESLAPKDVYLRTEDAGSVAANRFAHTTASPGGGATADVKIDGARGVWLLRDLQRISAATISERWRILDPTSV
jgi:hypothetical protein